MAPTARNARMNCSRPMHSIDCLPVMQAQMRDPRPTGQMMLKMPPIIKAVLSESFRAGVTCSRSPEVRGATLCMQQHKTSQSRAAAGLQVHEAAVFGDRDAAAGAASSSPIAGEGSQNSKGVIGMLKRERRARFSPHPQDR